MHLVLTSGQQRNHAYLLISVTGSTQWEKCKVDSQYRASLIMQLVSRFSAHGTYWDDGLVVEADTSSEVSAVIQYLAEMSRMSKSLFDQIRFAIIANSSLEEVRAILIPKMVVDRLKGRSKGG